MDKNKLARSFAKITANAKPKQLTYNPSATFDWIQTSGLPWLELDISVPYLDIFEEIKNIQQFFVPHRTEYNNNTGWESFCLHGKSYDATREHEHYSDDRQLTWTDEALKYMPKTVKYFKEVWPCREYDRLRIMKLCSKSIIELHRDGDNGTRMDPINIAINQPEGCNFYVESNGIVPFKQGSAIWLDVNNYHCVINDSDQDRYHIIIHQKTVTKEFENLVTRSYNKVYDHS